MNEYYGIPIAGLTLFLLSLGDMSSMIVSYILLLLATTYYIYESDKKKELAR